MAEKYLKIIDSTPFGPLVIIWSGDNDFPKVNRIILSNPEVSAEEEALNIYPDLKNYSCAEVNDLATDIKSFLEGENINFSMDMMDMDSCSPFQQEVLKAEYHIPRGNVSTYQFISRYLGRENGARAVGNALAKNPFPIIIPCHRAIRSDGSLGGFQGGVDMKRAILEKEGVVFDDKGILITKTYHYG